MVHAVKETFLPVDSSLEKGEAKKLPLVGSKGATTNNEDHSMLVLHGANNDKEENLFQFCSVISGLPQALQRQQSKPSQEIPRWYKYK